MHEISGLMTHSYDRSAKLYKRVRNIKAHHHDSNASSFRSIDIVFGVHTASYGSSAVVVQVVMQLAVSCSELLLLQEERIVEQCQSVEDVEVELCEHCQLERYQKKYLNKPS